MPRSRARRQSVERSRPATASCAKRRPGCHWSPHTSGSARPRRKFSETAISANPYLTFVSWRCAVPEVLTLAYSIGWVLTAIATYITSRRLRAKGSPPDRRLLVCLVAGAVWPLMLLGVVEIGVVAGAMKAARGGTSGQTTAIGEHVIKLWSGGQVVADDRLVTGLEAASPRVGGW
jgi:hypothetical protein